MTITRRHPLIVLLLSASFCWTSAPAMFGAASQVTVSGRKILVNGQPFSVQGVDYSPTPVGFSPAATSPGCSGGYKWWADPATYVTDFPLIKKMGANTIRAYGILDDTSVSTVAQVRAALDHAHSQGLYMVMNYYTNHFVDPSIPANQAAWQTAFVAGVNAYKDHPAVLIWEFGNENNIDNGQSNAWYPLVDQVAGAAKAADPSHPVMTVDAECPNCGAGIPINIGSVVRQADDANMTNLDLWGINVYRGPTYQGLFEALASSTAKPVLVAEFGKDAFWDAVAQEDGNMQATTISSQWQEIAGHLSASSPSGILAGGIAFEWVDEWWKAGGESCQAHNTDVLFSRAADIVDPNYQDEWFGLAAVFPIDPITNPGGTARRLRQSYYAMQRFWNPAASTEGSASASLFDGPVRNYPNPFRVGIDETRFVVNLNFAAQVSIAIFDAGQQFVTSLSESAAWPGRIVLTWRGSNSQGALVSPGLYFARIEASGSGKSETQYRRVVAVK